MHKLLKKSVLIPAAAILVIAVGAGLYWHSWTNQASKNSTQSGTYNPSQFNSDSNTPPSTSSSGGISSNKQSSGSQDHRAQTNAIPHKPIGTFVSNHRPNMSGSPSPNLESSTCSTTPGVTCQIVFKNGNLIKKLPAKTVDSNGNTSWVWRLQDIGLTTGTWTVTAVASNGSQQATSVDANNLIIQR